MKREIFHCMIVCVLALAGLVRAQSVSPVYNRRILAIAPVPLASDPTRFHFDVQWVADSYFVPGPRDLSSIVRVQVNGAAVGEALSPAVSSTVLSCCDPPPGTPDCPPISNPPLCFTGTCTLWNGTVGGMCDTSLYPGFDDGLCRCTGRFMVTVQAAAPLVAGDDIRVTLRPAPGSELELLNDDDTMETQFDEVPPEIVHGEFNVSVETHSYSGYIDPRMESSDGAAFDLGLEEVRLRFTEPVRNAGGAALSAAGFTLAQTGGGAPPVITDVLTMDAQSVTVRLSRPVTLGEWTTLRASVEDMIGVPILNSGDLGPEVVEFDRLDLSFLPGDVDQDGVVAPVDLLRFRQGVNDNWEQPAGALEDYLDMDRNGVISPIDLLRYRQLVMGSGNATQAWAGQALANEQP